MEFGWWRKPKLFREKIFNENYNITDKKSTEIFEIIKEKVALYQEDLFI